MTETPEPDPGNQPGALSPGPASAPRSDRRRRNLMIALIAAVAALVLMVADLSYLVLKRVRSVKNEPAGVESPVSTTASAPSSSPINPALEKPGPTPNAVAGPTSQPMAAANRAPPTLAVSATVKPTAVMAALPPASSPVAPVAGATFPASPSPGPLPSPGATPGSKLEFKPSAPPATGSPEIQLPLGPAALAGYPEPVQIALQFSTAEQNLKASGMAFYYADQVLWHGLTLSREDLLLKHGEYLAKISSYHLDLSNLQAKNDGAGRRAQVEYDVKAKIEWRSGGAKTFAIRKRLLLRKTDEGWKIECEEDVTHYYQAKGNLTDLCKL